MQFDYGLRGKRFLPVKQRPKSFKSSTGQKISVEKAVAVKNDDMMKKGQVSSV